MRGERRADLPDPEERAPEIDREHVVPFVGLDREEVADDRARGTVDEAPRLARLPERLDGSGPPGRLADVERELRQREVGGEDGVAVVTKP